MKLTTEQAQEIKDQQSQENKTKRVTAPALENILYEAMPALDHGFVRVVDYMGDDTSIVQSATAVVTSALIAKMQASSSALPAVYCMVIVNSPASRIPRINSR